MKLYGMQLHIAELIIVAILTQTLAKRCDRRPPGSLSSKLPVNGRYIIEIAGEPISYSPGKKYTITLRGVEQNEQNRFINFILLIESEGASKYNGNGFTQDVGNLQLLGDALTQFHDKCPNAVMETNSIPKSEIQVLWVAPPANSGCVAIRATVVLSREIWYSDDGPLSVILCENPQDGDDTQPAILSECCACHEAKYEVTFEGLWSRNTHPKDFPPNNFMTKFSDIIGATHSVDYKFWDYSDFASDGLKELAEHGNTKALERELKDMSDHIRTIIKARGISYPNITGRTFAVFRVDERHHLMSLVSMIHPSPDWIVGVSSLELCQSNCSWVESKVLNLYPWDAGTDNGTTYLSEDSPNYPRDPITKITSKNPIDSPFYDEQGAPMKPLARLILSRQRLYEKHTCNNTPVPNTTEGKEFCDVTEWSDWSPCSAICGKGTKHRQRTYKYKASDQIKQNTKCKKTLTQRGVCYGAQHECRTDQSIPGPDCELTPWGKLSECSVTCGNGTMTRSRRFKNHAAGKRCMQISSTPPLLEHNVPCTMPPCQENDPMSMPPECADHAWSEWSPCSVSCGKGVKTRKKLSITMDLLNKHNRISRSYAEEEEEEEEEAEEEGDEEDICANVIERVECVNDQMETCDETPTVTDGYQTDETSEKPVDCEVSQWSEFSPCSASCGRGTKMKTRQILQLALNGGKHCPKKLIKRKRCKVHCKIEQADCVMGKWSPWSPCNVTCGPNAVRQRARNILHSPKGGGRECPNRIEMQNCNLPVCPEV